MARYRLAGHQKEEDGTICNLVLASPVILFIILLSGG
ncbi:hypothetical protein J2T20_000757 [Paenibacillus wynnii]|nr:hypothetical protein [Paenibacillus wynnii]